MATPVAHKGATQAAKVHAMTVLDLLLRPDLVKAARDYFETVQGKQRRYQPIIRPQDQPAVAINREVMDRYRPSLRKFYYDPSRYKSYLEQLGVAYPPQ
jgi:aminobenzoyl-glutamate utilization protein B